MIYNEKVEIKERAIVFTSYTVKERNKIINFFLEKSNGLVSVNVFGFNSKRSQFKAILQPISQVDIHLIKKKNNSWSIIDANLVDSFDNLKSDYDKIETILSIFKTIENFPYKQSEIFNSILYKLVIKFIKYLQENNRVNLKISELFFFYYFIYSLGYKLNPTEKCFACNVVNLSKYNGKPVTFSFENGNMICDSCKVNFREDFLDLKRSFISISYNAFNLFTKFEVTKFSDLNKIEDKYVNDILYREIKLLYSYYLRYHLDRKVYL